jgi:hypothetical protein
MKSFKEKLAETVDKIKSPDEQNFADKHIVDKKGHPHAKEDQFVAKAKKAKRQADHEEGQDAEVYEEARQIECPDCGATYPKGEEHECKEMGESSYGKKKKKPMTEEEMTAAQEKKREEIVKSMKKKMGEFKDRYGDDAEKVMYATATKQAMKEEVEEEVIYEAVIDDLRKIVKNKQRADIKFADGKKLKVDGFSASALVQVHDALSGANQAKFADAINKGETTFMKMLDFAFSAAKRR